MNSNLGKNKSKTKKLNKQINSESKSQEISSSFPSSFKIENYSYDKVKKLIIEDEEDKEFIKTNKIKEQREKNNKIQNFEISRTINDIIQRNEDNINNNIYSTNDKESSSSAAISFSNFDELELDSDYDYNESLNDDDDLIEENNNLYKNFINRKRKIEKENIIKDNNIKDNNINDNKNDNKNENNNSMENIFEEFDNEIKEHKIRKLKKNKDNKELKLSLDVECAICMNRINELANPNGCEHDFCKNCLLSWAEKSTQCPICKNNFSKIYIYYKGKKREIKFNKKKYNPFYNDNNYNINLNNYDDDFPCYVCNRYTDAKNMLICDKCDRNYCHYYCDGLKKLPKKNEKWFCYDCKRDMKEEKKKMKEIGKKLIE